MVGGDEESEADAESGTRVDVRSRNASEQARDEKPKSRGATAMEDGETDAENGKATYLYERVRGG
jgi:hypothetical protein